jgi:hypothetical protein
MAASSSGALAQDLISYPFKESRLANQQESVIGSTKNMNSNPLLKDYDVKFYGLDVEADNRSDRIHGSVTILVEVSGTSLDTLVFDLHDALFVDRVMEGRQGMACLWRSMMNGGYRLPIPVRNLFIPETGFHASRTWAIRPTRSMYLSPPTMT